jgi:putative colanic acid biosynthesis UDP-glucose lipid carrier transferase
LIASEEKQVSTPFAGERRIRQQASLLGLWYRLADALCIVLGLLLAVSNDLATRIEHYVLPAAVAMVVYSLMAELIGMYRSWRGVSPGREIFGALICWASTLFCLLMLAFIAGYTAEYSRLSMLLWFASTPFYIVFSRTLIRWLQRLLLQWGYHTKRFAIVGVTELGFQLARNVEDSPELGLKLVGFFDDRPEPRNPEIPDRLGRQVGTLHDLLEQTREGKVDRIYITFPMRAEGRIRGVLKQLSDTTASVFVVPDFFVFQLLQSRWTDIHGLPAVSVFDHPFYGIDGVAKRASDLILGSIFLTIAAIPMVVIGLAIRLTSPGPALFRQRRYGLDGREIRMWKFRTMNVVEDSAKAVQAKRNDPRVTRIGRILRQTSLDELPQLFNVIGGSMSLVGPRPHATAQNDEFRKRVTGYMLRHKVKPGITGLAQVNGCRGGTDSPEMIQKRIEYDHRYIREWSLWLDIMILLKTVAVVLSRRNAY